MQSVDPTVAKTVAEKSTAVGVWKQVALQSLSPPHLSLLGCLFCFHTSLLVSLASTPQSTWLSLVSTPVYLSLCLSRLHTSASLVLSLSRLYTSSNTSSRGSSNLLKSKLKAFIQVMFTLFKTSDYLSLLLCRLQTIIDMFLLKKNITFWYTLIMSESVSQQFDFQFSFMVYIQQFNFPIFVFCGLPPSALNFLFL